MSRDGRGDGIRQHGPAQTAVACDRDGARRRLRAKSGSK